MSGERPKGEERHRRIPHVYVAAGGGAPLQSPPISGLPAIPIPSGAAASFDCGRDRILVTPAGHDGIYLTAEGPVGSDGSRPKRRVLISPISGEVLLVRSER
jgi:hypothetical protein